MNYKLILEKEGMTPLYRHTDYRHLLRELADVRKATHAAYRYAALAKAMGVLPPYLSRVFRQEAHLSSDQIHLACDEFQLSEEDAVYVHLLLEFQRSGLAKRRELLKKKIKEIQEAKRDTKNYLQAEKIGPEQAELYQEYFLEPLAPLVHVFLALPAYQSDPQRICRHLSLSPSKLEEILRRLERLGMVEYNRQRRRYRLLREHLHLEKSSILNQAYQLLFRASSAEHVKRISGHHKHQYAVTFGADEETKAAIYDEFNAFMKRVEVLVHKAPAEGVFQLNFDLFRWDAEENWGVPARTAAPVGLKIRKPREDEDRRSV